MSQTKQKKLLLPILEISNRNHEIINDIRIHKTSKSVCFPKIPSISLTPIVNSSIIPGDSQLLKEFNEDNSNKKDYHSPIKRLLKFAGESKVNKNQTKEVNSKKIKRSTELEKTSETSLNLSQLLIKRDLMLHWAKARNSKRILEQLFENLWLASKLGSMKLLTDTIFLIGDLYLCDGNLEGAVYAYYHMKILCDLTQNYKMKLYSILALANCCKILKRNNQALFLYKKALEYVWKIRDEETEAKIYDRIGMIYFHFGEIRKARYYHDRSLEYKLESEISPSKYSSSIALDKYHDSLKSLYFDSITPILLGKLGISFQFQENIDIMSDKKKYEEKTPDSNETHSISEEKLENNEKILTFEENQQNIPKVKFNTNLNIEALLENLFFEKDLTYEIPSPRYPRGYSEQDILLGRTDIVGMSKRPKGNANDLTFSVNQLNLLNMNTQKNRKPVVKIDLDPMQMKIPIADKIKLRNQIVRHLKNKATIFGNKMNSKNKIKAQELLGFGLYYNHLTPNRNLEAFNYHFKNKFNKLDRYYQNLSRIEDLEEGKDSGKEKEYGGDYVE